MRSGTLAMLIVSVPTLAAACASAPEPPVATPAPATAAPVVPAAPVTPPPADTATTAAATPPAPPAVTPVPLALPGAPPEGVFMDYLAVDRAAGRVWVPAGNTGSVDVIDHAAGDKITRIEGFPTKEMERNGKKRVVGPSGATVGDGFVYVGSRSDSSVCAIDSKTLKKAGCVTLPSTPDGLAYIASTKEVWATTPHDKSIAVLDVSKPGAPKVKGKITTDGEAEGYAVDDKRGLFFTNLEDKDRTLAIGLKDHKVVSTWMPKCGEDGPKGLALDHDLDFLFVACSDHVIVLDAGHDGKLLSQVDTGPGVDNLDYLEAKHQLYVAAGKAAKLTIAGLSPAGALAVVSTVTTAKGARNGVVDADGNAYLADSAGGRILFVPAAPAAH